MPESRINKQKTRTLSTLKDKALGLCTIGLGMLIIPLFMDRSPMLAAFAGAVRPMGWLALAAGLALLGVHHVVRAKVAEAAPSPEAACRAPASAGHAAARDMRHDSRGNPTVQGPPGSTTRQTETRWSPTVFADIEWRRFEAVCEKLFGQAGFETKSQSHGADGGVDIWLHSRNAEGPVAVVQCKHWQGKAVGVKELREFLGVMASNKLTRGTYATTSTYTADAQRFAKDNGVNALDGKGLLALIAKRTPEQQQALLDIAYQGEYWRPTCASCGIKMVERTPARGGAKFWGCSEYPKCKSRLPMAVPLL